MQPPISGETIQGKVSAFEFYEHFLHNKQSLVSIMDHHQNIKQFISSMCHYCHMDSMFWLKCTHFDCSVLYTDDVNTV